MAAPTPVLVGETLTYKVDYELGIMINYAVSKDAISPYVKAPLTPAAIRMLEHDTEPKYYVCLYLAKCALNDNPTMANRADVFTVIRDAEGHLGLLFLSVLCDVPSEIPKSHVPKFIKMQEKFMLDAETGKCSVPHQVIDKLILNHDGVHLEMGSTVFQSTFKGRDTHLFHNDFIACNSQIFQNSRDRTVNYFNQEFMCTQVSDIDISSVNQLAPENFHPLCTTSNLDSIHKYGNSANPITWYFKAPPGAILAAKMATSKL